MWNFKVVAPVPSPLATTLSVCPSLSLSLWFCLFLWLQWNEPLKRWLRFSLELAPLSRLGSSRLGFIHAKRFLSGSARPRNDGLIHSQNIQKTGSYCNYEIHSLSLSRMHTLCLSFAVPFSVYRFSSQLWQHLIRSFDLISLSLTLYHTHPLCLSTYLCVCSFFFQALNGFLMILTCEGEVFFATHSIESYLGFHQVSGWQCGVPRGERVRQSGHQFDWF